MYQFTTEQAIAFGKAKVWESMSKDEIAEFQLCQRKMCIPFDVLHGAVEHRLGRPVFSHEFCDIDSLVNEMNGIRPAKSIEEILQMIPAEKRVIIMRGEEK